MIDRQTDRHRWMDARGKTMSPDPSGEDIIILKNRFKCQQTPFRAEFEYAFALDVNDDNLLLL